MSKWKDTNFSNEPVLEIKCQQVIIIQNLFLNLGDWTKIDKVTTLKCALKLSKRKTRLTPSLYCMGPKVAEPKKWLVPNFIFKGWKWCIWTITTIIHHQIWSADSTAEITVIQSSKLSTLRSTFGRVPVNFFNCSGWNYFNFYIYFLISLKNFTDLDVWAPFRPRLFLHFRQK